MLAASGRKPRKNQDDKPTLAPAGDFISAKRRRLLQEEELKTAAVSAEQDVTKIIVQFKSTDGSEAGPLIEVPINITTEQLHILLNQLLNNEEKRPYSFFVNEEEIIETVKEAVSKQALSTESVLPIIYQPQALFRVRSVSRCTSSLPGHAEAVLHVHFSPDGRHLASGSGDATVRLWDPFTETPVRTFIGHKNWVLAVCWSPNGKLVASGSMNGDVRIWNVETGKEHCKPLLGHAKWVSGLSWEPMHKNPQCSRIASCSKDATVRIWDVIRGQCLLTLGGHRLPVKSIVWGGEGLLYSASQDRTIHVWETERGKLVRTLDGHAHWVNTLSVSTWHALRLGPFDHTGSSGDSQEPDALRVRAQAAYDKAKQATDMHRELLVSGSDDFTLFLWDPTSTKVPIKRMTGHQQPINFVCYSPDARYIASASFDNSVKLWHGSTGAYIASFRAHVQAVYQVAWSPDSRMLVSSSKDSTMKVWEVRTKKLKEDLPGHADEVYAVDWSPDGDRVASGGKDKVLRMWKH